MFRVLFFLAFLLGMGFTTSFAQNRWGDSFAVDSVEFAAAGVISQPLVTQNRLRVTLIANHALRVGMEGELYKHFERPNPFGRGTIKGKMAIARVRVIAVDKDETLFEIVRELSVININDKKVDHFEKGAAVTFIWKTPVAGNHKS